MAHRRAAALFALLPLAATGTSCTWFEGSPYVLVSSEPAGARILVDGEDSGLTTPARLELGSATGGDHKITVRKAGFVDEERTVYHYTTTSMARWIDGSGEPDTWQLPLFWSAHDFLFPFSVRWQYVPAELRIVLYPEGGERPGGP